MNVTPINTFIGPKQKECTYRYISHEQVHNIFRNALNRRGIRYTFETQRLGSKTTKLGFKLTLSGYEKTINGDRVAPSIIGVNSLKKESSLNFRAGFYRFACANQMTVGENFFIGKIIHRKGETFEQKLLQIDCEIERFLAKVDEVFGQVEAATSQYLTVFQMANILKQTKVPEKVKKLAYLRIWNPNIRREEDRANNIWTLWNIINESIRDTCEKEAARERHNNKLMENVLELAKAA